MKDYYEILGVSKNASEKEIKNVFRTKAKETHPDLNNNDLGLVKHFHEITEAYSVLINPEKRKEYDNLLKDNSNNFDSYDTPRGAYYNFTLKEINEELIKEFIFMINVNISPYKKEAARAIWIGIAWFLGGAFISYWSYLNADQNDGSYFIFGGAIIFGAIQAIRGGLAYNEINNELNKVEEELWEIFDERFDFETTFDGYNQTEFEFNSMNQDNNQSSNTYEENFDTYEDISEEKEVNHNDIAVEEKENSVFPIIIFITFILLIVLALQENLHDTKNLTPVSNFQEDSNQIKSVDKSKNTSLIKLNVNAIISSIDFNEAVRFTKRNYQGRDLHRLATLMKNRGYEINNYDEKNLEQILAAVAHYQRTKKIEIDGRAGPITMSTLAIDIAKDLVGNDVESFIKSDSNIKKKYGWNAVEVEKFVYFVSYEFDYDSDKTNGYYLYAYEVHMLNERINEMEGATLEKYRKLGLIE